MPRWYIVTLKVTDNYTLWNTTSKILNVYYRTDLDKDGKVSIEDIYIAAKAFGTKPEDKNWNAIADINKDEKVGTEDIYFIARDFGKFSEDLWVPTTLS